LIELTQAKRHRILLPILAPSGELHEEQIQPNAPPRATLDTSIILESSEKRRDRSGIERIDERRA
jgi:hypothetical protein